jgi:hypothetical protein
MQWFPVHFPGWRHYERHRCWAMWDATNLSDASQPSHCWPHKSLSRGQCMLPRWAQKKGCQLAVGLSGTFLLAYLHDACCFNLNALYMKKGQCSQLCFVCMCQEGAIFKDSLNQHSQSIAMFFDCLGFWWYLPLPQTHTMWYTLQAISNRTFHCM